MKSCELGKFTRARANLGSLKQTIKKQEEMLFVRGESEQLWDILSGLLIPI
jgi:hypothetical protein